MDVDGARRVGESFFGDRSCVGQKACGQLEVIAPRRRVGEHLDNSVVAACLFSKPAELGAVFVDAWLESDEGGHALQRCRLIAESVETEGDNFTQSPDPLF